MALTIVSPTEPNLTGAIGAPVQINFTVNSSTDLSGQTMYLRFGQFLTLGEPAPVNITTESNTYSWVYNSNATSETLQPRVVMSPTLELMRVFIDTISTTSFDVTIDFLLKADRIGYDTGTINKLVHFENNTITSAPLENTAPSVYNQLRLFRVEVSEYTNTSINARAVYDEQFSARFWCEDLFDCSDLFPAGCVAGIVSNWDFSLTRGGVPVESISITEPTNLIANVTVTTGTIDEFYVAAYKRNGAGSTSEYWNDLNMAYASFSPAISTLDNSPFDLGPFLTGPLQFNNVIGDSYEVEIPMDHSYFELGCEYRFFVVAKHSDGSHYSCNTPVILANLITPPIAFTTTDEIFDYSSNSKQYQSCVTNVACGERLRICVDADTVEYNTNAAAMGIGGTFDSNFIGLGVHVLDRLPNTMDILNESQAYTVFENPNASATNSGGCIEFAVPDEWVGQTRYIVFSYVFEVTVGSVTYPEYGYHTVRVSTIGASNDLTATITQSGEAIEKRICQDNTDPVIVEVSNALSGTFDIIGFIKSSASNIWLEQSNYDNDTLEQLTTDAIISIDSDFATGSAEIQIDPTQLSVNQEYCVKAVAKPKVFVPPPVCSPIDVEFTAAVASVVELVTGQIVVTFSIFWEYTGSETIETISIIGNQLQPVVMTGSGNSGNIQGFQVTYDNSISFSIFMQATIEMESGCNYSTDNIADPFSRVLGPLQQMFGSSATSTITFNV